MPRRPHPGDPRLRRVLKGLRARAEACPGPWHIVRWPDGGTISWRESSGDIDRHDLRLDLATYEDDARRARLVEALPDGFAPVGATAGEGSVVLRLGYPRTTCSRCGEAMDELARWARAEDCSGCALELGTLTGL